MIMQEYYRFNTIVGNAAYGSPYWLFHELYPKKLQINHRPSEGGTIHLEVGLPFPM